MSGAGGQGPWGPEPSSQAAGALGFAGTANGSLQACPSWAVQGGPFSPHPLRVYRVDLKSTRSVGAPWLQPSGEGIVEGSGEALERDSQPSGRGRQGGSAWG